MAVGASVSEPAGGYQYSCFISYKRPIRPKNLRPDQRRAFSNNQKIAIARAVESSLIQVGDLPLAPFRDEGLEPGDDLGPKLSEALCQSACMVAIITPGYFESDWCVGEWEAMKRLEDKRTPGRRNLIIPILFRGKFEEMVKHCEGRLLTDLEIVDPLQLGNRGKRLLIEGIASKIDNAIKSVVACNCGADFQIERGKPKVVGNDADPLAS